MTGDSFKQSYITGTFFILSPKAKPNTQIDSFVNSEYIICFINFQGIFVDLRLPQIKGWSKNR